MINLTKWAEKSSYGMSEERSKSRELKKWIWKAHCKWCLNWDLYVIKQNSSLEISELAWWPGCKRALKTDKAKAENLDKLFNLVSIVKDAGEFSVHNDSW